MEYDVRGLFDNIDHELLLKALRHHCDERWILLYAKRWLIAPMQQQDGQLIGRSVGTPQGGPIHHCWPTCFYIMRWTIGSNCIMKTFHFVVMRTTEFCTATVSIKRMMREHLDARLREVGLELHPEKTWIVYRKDSNRKDNYEAVQFDFLG